MALITPSFQDEKYLLLNAPEMPPLKVPLSKPEQKMQPIVKVRIWGDHCDAVDEGDECSIWFRKFLNSEHLRLVRMTESHDRIVEEPFRQEGFDNLCSFTDEFPFLLASKESLKDLNSRIEGKVLPMKRFRPNLIIEGGKPFLEDTLKRIKVGNVVMRIIKPHTRCKVTTIDPETGKFDGEEPLKTLKTFRLGLMKEKPKDVFFGVDVLHENQGEIHAGDSITLLDDT